MTGAPGFQWSLGCVGPVGWGGLSLEPLSDGGSALFVNVDVGALDLGGDDLMVIGGGDMALARHDAEGSAVWSDVWGNDGAQWAFGGDGLPGGGLVIGLYSEDGPIEVGGAPIELDPSLGSAVVVALDGGGAARWSHVASTMVPDSVIGVAVVAAEDGSVLASFSAPEPGPIFLDGVGPHDVGEGRLAARFSADG